MKKRNNIYRIIVTMCAALAFLSGCATQATHFKLAASLQKDLKTFGGADYMRLDKFCNYYGLDYKYDTFSRVATISKRSEKVILRPDSFNALVNGEMVKISRPAVLSGGELYAPSSFLGNNLGRLADRAEESAIPVIEGPKKYRIRTIVVDAGHGGKDPGAIGRRSYVKEKILTLELAEKIKSLLEDAGIKVILTRDDDTFIPLPDRADIANRAAADLFISVHINASRARAMRGFECYYLSNATDDNARALEALENSSLKTAPDAAAEHSRPLDKTLWDMALTENRIESSQLAGYICDSVDEGLAIGNRGVKSARFYVLKHTNMPSVLVEAGYISNKYEEIKLKDPEFLGRLAESVTRGILKYKMEYERTEGFSRA